MRRVTDEMRRYEDKQFDDAFPDGVFAVPRDPREPRVKIRALHQYCKETGKTPQELTEKEMQKFLKR